MSYSTLIVQPGVHSVTLTIHRPEHQNSIDDTLLAELLHALDAAEADPECRLIVLAGENGVFCTGMDFAAVAHQAAAGSTEAMRSSRYMEVLRRFATIPRTVIAKVDGRVTAGGVGFVAASDLVVATERSQFSLSEALWGLLPCCVMPYLVRRIGFQPAYRLTLTTQAVSAREALPYHLVDEVSNDPDDIIRKWMLRVAKLEPETLRELKAYFRQMWIVDEAMERHAVAEISRLVAKPRVIENITNFVTRRQFPWETAPHP
jgi:polyketide biosynthesis enoyl-CoA hydratase PksH